MDHLMRRFARTSSVLRQEAERRMAAAGGTMSEWMLLGAALTEPGLSQRDLAGRLGLEANTLTHHLDRMEADALLTRTRDGNDRRVLRVKVTARGKRRYEALTRALDVLEDDVRSPLTAAEARTLAALLDRVHDHLHPDPRGAHPWPTPDTAATTKATAAKAPRAATPKTGAASTGATKGATTKRDTTKAGARTESGRRGAAARKA